MVGLDLRQVLVIGVRYLKGVSVFPFPIDTEGRLLAFLGVQQRLGGMRGGNPEGKDGLYLILPFFDLCKISLVGTTPTVAFDMHRPAGDVPSRSVDRSVAVQSKVFGKCLGWRHEREFIEVLEDQHSRYLEFFRACPTDIGVPDGTPNDRWLRCHQLIGEGIDLLPRRGRHDLLDLRASFHRKLQLIVVSVEFPLVMGCSPHIIQERVHKPFDISIRQCRHNSYLFQAPPPSLLMVDATPRCSRYSRAWVIWSTWSS